MRNVLLLVAAAIVCGCAPASSFVVPPRKKTALHACVRSRAALYADAAATAAAAPPPTRTLSELFPAFAPSLSALRLASPTPIQSASAAVASAGEDVLLVAPTGSGKSLAYLLPALSAAADGGGTVLVVAPVRELALQLAAVAGSLLADGGSSDVSVRLAVPGVPPPAAEELAGASVLVGTPSELRTLVEGGAAADFVAALSGIVLDEVDVLLPPPTKAVRTSLDGHKNRDNKNLTADERNKAKQLKIKNSQMSQAQRETRDRAQKRKTNALKRQKDTDASSGRAVSPTERVLRAIGRAGTSARPPQILAGSATASRRTSEVLNGALRQAWRAAPGAPARVPVRVLRPASERSVEESNDIAVPSQVAHRCVILPKGEAASADAVLAAVARTADRLGVAPRTTALVFLCGEFGKADAVSIRAEAATDPPAKGGVRKKKRAQNVQRKVSEAKARAQANSGQPDAVSAHAACATLAAHGLDAQPLHVALGFGPSAGNPPPSDAPRFLVAPEEAARGLHLDDVDAVFLVGRPASAASYLHLAGRVGRSRAGDGGAPSVRPGTVVSLCTVGGARELGTWVRKVGGTALEELVLDGAKK